jgi:hypothetical protein
MVISETPTFLGENECVCDRDDDSEKQGVLHSFTCWYPCGCFPLEVLFSFWFLRWKASPTQMKQLPVLLHDWVHTTKGLGPLFFLLTTNRENVPAFISRGNVETDSTSFCNPFSGESTEPEVCVTILQENNKRNDCTSFWRPFSCLQSSTVFYFLWLSCFLSHKHTSFFEQLFFPWSAGIVHLTMHDIDCTNSR